MCRFLESFKPDYALSQQCIDASIRLQSPMTVRSTRARHRGHRVATDSPSQSTPHERHRLSWHAMTGWRQHGIFRIRVCPISRQSCPRHSNVRALSNGIAQSMVPPPRPNTLGQDPRGFSDVERGLQLHSCVFSSSQDEALTEFTACAKPSGVRSGFSGVRLPLCWST